MSDVDEGGLTRLTEDPLNLRPKNSNTDIRRKFWSQRVIRPWNELPREVKHAGSINAFKQLYDAYMIARAGTDE